MAIATYSSKDELVTATLAELGSTSTFASIESATSNLAVAIRNGWPVILREVQVRHPWNSCIKRASLNEASPPPAFGYARKYKLPADCLRWLPPAIDDAAHYVGEREGDFILTDAGTPLPCRYIALVDDVSKWTPGLAMAIRHALKALIADVLTQSTGRKQASDAVYDEAVRIGMRIDGLEGGRRLKASAGQRPGYVRAARTPNSWKYR